jgi:hypothetical protein
MVTRVRIVRHLVRKETPMERHQTTHPTPAGEVATPWSTRPLKLDMPGAANPTATRTLGWSARDPSGTHEDPGAIEYASWLRLLQRMRP